MSKTSTVNERTSLMNYRLILGRELENRCAENEKYSLRAFSKDLGVSPSRISEILKSKQGLSVKAAEEIAEKLKFTIQEKAHFCQLVHSETARSNHSRRAQLKQLGTPVIEGAETVSAESMHWISDVRCFAILEILEKHPRIHVKSMSDRLNIELPELQRLLKSLLASGEVVLKANGEYQVPKKVTKSQDEIPSKAIQMLHQSAMREGIKAIDRLPIDQRESSTMTFVLDKKDIPWLKAEMKKFRDELAAQIVAKKKNKDAIVTVNLNMFRMDSDEE